MRLNVGLPGPFSVGGNLPKGLGKGCGILALAGASLLLVCCCAGTIGSALDSRDEPRPPGSSSSPTVSVSPSPDVQVEPTDDPTESPEPDLYFKSCIEAKRAGVPLPLRRGDPGYRTGLDADGDGKACER